jgi:glycosyltransferase involved in cell wall biosynthesis
MEIKYSPILFLIIITLIYAQYVPMDKTMEQPFRNYVTICKQGILLPNRIFKKSSKPKISIIIPMYNEAKNAQFAIRTIQNQNLQDLEIVCVNDNSNDDTLKVLEKLQEEDPRITILTNKSNRGVIYNRIYGSLMSKGEYITFIDADDGFCNMKILQTSYDIATKKHGEKIDMIHYQSCGAVVDENGEIGNFLVISTYNPYNFEKVIKQPEISDNYMQKSNNITGSGFVFDKIYSRELMKRVADYLGPSVWNQNLVFSDDFLLAYGAMRMTNSIVNIGEIGYWHNFDTQTSTTSNVWQLDGYKLKNPEKSNKKIGDYILITERILELTENEPQFLEFREHTMRKLGEETFIKAVARSIYYDRYLTICENFINWKYINKAAKERSLKFMKYLLSFNVETRNKFSDVLDEDEYTNNNNNKNKDEDYEEYDDDMINNGIEDL